MIRRLLGRRPPAPARDEHWAVGAVLAEGARPLAPGAAEAAGRDRLHVAVVLSWFFAGSGGHQTIFDLVRGLEARGHEVSLWLHDPTGRHALESEATTNRLAREHYGPVGARIRNGFDEWSGADVVLATGWQTVDRTLLLDGARARAYLVQDHEPEFHPTSAERRWAEETYRRGLHCVTAGSWLAELMRERYGASATHFDLGVDHDRYGARPVERDPATVLFYCRPRTPRRGVPLGMLALAELQRRRPEVRIELFGDAEPPPAEFGFRNLGVLPQERLADAYSRATAGLVLSMTNHSLIPQEMLACGLPCVDLDTPSTRAAFGAVGPVELVPADPAAIAGALERLLADPALADERRRAGLALVAARTWDAAAAEVEEGLREALRRAAR